MRSGTNGDPGRYHSHGLDFLAPGVVRRNLMRGRALFVTSNFPRWLGDSTTPFVLDLARDLKDLGWEIDVLAPHAPGARRREVMEGVRVERFRYLWPESLETVCYGGGALINLRDQPSNLLKLPFLVGAELLETLERARSRRYRVIHSHWILPQGFVGSIAAKANRIPHIVTVHGGDIFALRGSVLNAFKRFSLHQADAVTVNSSTTRAAVAKVAPRVKEMHQIPMGVGTDADPPTDLVSEIRGRFRRGNGPLIVFAGRMVPEKGVEDLIRAVALLVPRTPDVSVMLLGEGQHRSRMMSLATDLGFADRIHFLGWVPPADVAAHLAAGDVFVAPSRRARNGWMEAQGLSLVEAMSVALPVIATRTGGIGDAVKEGQTGLLVPERSPPAIAAAVERLSRDRELTERLGQGAQQLARGRYSRKEVALRFSRLFDDVIGQEVGRS
jgi:phosphatidylinositol alpha-1,6-mannosyltransferase